MQNAQDQVLTTQLFTEILTKLKLEQDIQNNIVAQIWKEHQQNFEYERVPKLQHSHSFYQDTTARFRASIVFLLLKLSTLVGLAIYLFYNKSLVNFLKKDYIILSICFVLCFLIIVINLKRMPFKCLMSVPFSLLKIFISFLSLTYVLLVVQSVALQTDDYRYIPVFSYIQFLATIFFLLILSYSSSMSFEKKSIYLILSNMISIAATVVIIIKFKLSLLTLGSIGFSLLYLAVVLISIKRDKFRRSKTQSMDIALKLWLPLVGLALISVILYRCNS